MPSQALTRLAPFARLALSGAMGKKAVPSAFSRAFSASAATHGHSLAALSVAGPAAAPRFRGVLGTRAFSSWSRFAATPAPPAPTTVPAAAVATPAPPAQVTATSAAAAANTGSTSAAAAPVTAAPAAAGGAGPASAGASVLDGHAPPQGFTGVYDAATKRLRMRPSASSARGRRLPSGFVPRRGGHAIVSQELGGDSKDHHGFAVILQDDGTVHVTWRSGQLNQGPENLVPQEHRSAIVAAVERDTGKRVSSH